MSLPATLFATDEDLAIRAGADFADLAPSDGAVAAGDDGAFAGGSRWTLTSASVAFAAQGAAAGMVAAVYLPALGDGDERQFLIVDSLPGGGGVTLRRKGLASGVGQPPGPIGGTDGVRFTVATMTAEIARASFDLAHRLGLDETVPGRRLIDLADATQLVEPTVLIVLQRRYAAIAQRGNPETTAAPATEAQARAASFWAKARALAQELNDTLDRLSVNLRYAASASGAPAPPITRFGTRLSR